MVVGGLKKKARITSKDEREEEDDMISRLPDELIHQILEFVDTKLAVQTSVLSKRWKLVWTTLPFLNSSIGSPTQVKFIKKLLAHRNHDSEVLKLDLTFRNSHFSPSLTLVNNIIKYAISHHVQQLKVDFTHEYNRLKYSSLSSCTIKELTLSLYSCNEMLASDCWDLPALTTLRLIRPFCDDLIHLPESFLSCLPGLQTLLLDGFELPKSICLPNLTTLVLDDVEFTYSATEFFNALVNLRNLTCLFKEGICADIVINCPQLLNLNIEYYACTTPGHSCEKFKVIVLAPNIRNFSVVGFCPVTFGVAKLENVNIKLEDSTQINTAATDEEIEEYCRLITNMLGGLSGAKILTIDLNTIEALSLISDLLANFPSPFFNLKYVKLPHGCKKTSISSTIRSYLIDGSPTATIVTALPQNSMIPHTAAASLTAQNMVRQMPLAAPTKVLVDSENIHKTVCVDTRYTTVQDEHIAQNSALYVDKVRQIGPLVERTGNDGASNSGKISDVGLWQGHEINSEFVCLLDLIMKKYPETFEHFTTKNKKLGTMKLHMLCTSVNNFTKISLSEVDIEMIAECRDVFSGLQKFGFNVSWLVNRLNYIEQLRFSHPLVNEIYAIDCRINDAKTKWQHLQTLRAEKMQEIQEAFGTMGTNLVVGCIGDDLLSGP